MQDVTWSSETAETETGTHPLYDSTRSRNPCIQESKPAKTPRIQAPLPSWPPFDRPASRGLV
jgi:hypothetical protein